MKKPMKPGGGSPGYGSPGYGTAPRSGRAGQRGSADKDAHSSGDFGSAGAGGGGRRGSGGRRRRQAGGGFGSDYADDGSQFSPRGGGGLGGGGLGGGGHGGVGHGGGHGEHDDGY